VGTTFLPLEIPGSNLEDQLLYEVLYGASGKGQIVPSFIYFAVCCTLHILSLILFDLKLLRALLNTPRINK